MIQVTVQTRILVAIEPVDFRRGIDGLARIVREMRAADPFSGCVFVFRNRRGTALKLLAYDGQGFWLCQKRLSNGRFCHWPKSPDQPMTALQAHELSVLLRGGDPMNIPTAPEWRAVQSNALQGGAIQGVV